MSLLRSAVGISTALVVAMMAPPAYADDFTLSCKYGSSGPSLLVKYDAGGPSWTLTAVSVGTSTLIKDRADQANAFSSSSEMIYFTKGDQQEQMIFRVKTTPLTSTLELGGGLIADHRIFAGRCEVLDQ